MTLKLLTNKWVLSGLAAILVLFFGASDQQGYKKAKQKTPSPNPKKRAVENKNCGGP